MADSKNVILLGATGAVGSCLLKSLEASDLVNTLYVVSRRELAVNPDKTHLIVVEDLLDADYESLDVDAVFCALGTTIKVAGSQERFREIDYKLPSDIARKLKSAGASEFYLVSSVGADSDSPFFYNKVKGDLEKTIRKQRWQKLRIFRPSLLLGERSEFRPAEKIGQILMKPFAFLIPQSVRPIKFEQLARAIMNEFESPEQSEKTIQGRRLFSASK